MCTYTHLSFIFHKMSVEMQHYTAKQFFLRDMSSLIKSGPFYSKKKSGPKYMQS